MPEVCQTPPDAGANYTDIGYAPVVVLIALALIVLAWGKAPPKWRSWLPALGGLLVIVVGAMIVIGSLRVAFGH